MGAASRSCHSKALARSMKILLIVLDGLGDRPSPLLDNLTPLEAAPTPNLDRLAAAAANGRFWAVEPWLPVGTAMAHHVMFGYDPAEFADRAVLMALARGFPPQPDDVVFAARFASAVPGGDHYRLRERFIRGAEDACAELAESIGSWNGGGLEFSYRYCGRGDGLLTVRGDASPEVTDSDPLGLDLPVIEIQALEAAANDEAAQSTAVALNAYLEWAHRTLSEHPANTRRGDAGELPINMLITKWGGRLRALEPFAERHGVRAAGVPGEEIVDGAQRAVGMMIRKVAPQAAPRGDLEDRLGAAFALFADNYEFVHLHTKEPDATGHWSDPVRKRDVIAALDSALDNYVERLVEDTDLVVAVTGDHCTPSSWNGLGVGDFNDQHSGEAVPILVRGSHALVDGVATFGERPAAGGALGTVLGTHLMPMLLALADRTNVAGVRPTPRPTSYRPRNVRALRPPASR
ncbi:MAG: phosphoglycerate mutase [Dehalococcoidia bacterium]|nr:phosphoglycerate mutase [Dehalococcoidia bacterium]